MADWKGRIGRATISKISIADFDDGELEGQPALVKYRSLILMTEDWKGNH
jgi:hypothetical protein